MKKTKIKHVAEWAVIKRPGEAPEIAHHIAVSNSKHIREVVGGDFTKFVDNIGKKVMSFHFLIDGANQPLNVNWPKTLHGPVVVYGVDRGLTIKGIPLTMPEAQKVCDVLAAHATPVAAKTSTKISLPDIVKPTPSLPSYTPPSYLRIVINEALLPHHNTLEKYRLLSVALADYQTNRKNYGGSGHDLMNADILDLISRRAMLAVIIANEAAGLPPGHGKAG